MIFDSSVFIVLRIHCWQALYK